MRPFVLASIVAGCPSAVPAAPDEPPGSTVFGEVAVQRADVPGIGIAVVRAGRVASHRAR